MDTLEFTKPIRWIFSEDLIISVDGIKCETLFNLFEETIDDGSSI